MEVGCLSDDEFVEVLKRNKDTVFRVALSYFGNVQDAEDISQEVFIRFFKKNISFKSCNEEKAWFIRVTINRCHDVWRSAWFKKRAAFTELNDVSFIPEEEELINEVMKLPDKYKIIIYLYYYEEYSIKEIAEIMNMKQATVMTRLSRGREKLKHNLENKEGEVYGTL